MRALVCIAKDCDNSNAINLVYNLGVIGADYPDEMREHEQFLLGIY